MVLPIKDLETEIFDKEEIEFAKEFLEKLKDSEEISEEEQERYCKWKSAIQNVVKEHFTEFYIST